MDGSKLKEFMYVQEILKKPQDEPSINNKFAFDGECFFFNYKNGEVGKLHHTSWFGQGIIGTHVILI